MENGRRKLDFFVFLFAFLFAFLFVYLCVSLLRGLVLIKLF